jgi:hypothetical protein
VELLFCLVYSLPVLTVHDKYEALRSGIVVSPKWPNLILTPDVPDIELDVLVSHCLDVKSDCGARMVRTRKAVNKKKERTRWNCGN